MARDDWSGDRVRRARAWLRGEIEAGRMSPDCCLCGLPIDLAVEWPSRDAMTVQHVVPRSVAPHLTDDHSNWAPAHGGCNSASGSALAGVPLGRRSSW